jgi:ribosomal protein S10
MTKNFNFQLFLNSIDKRSILIYQRFLIKMFKCNNTNFKTFFLPKKKKRITLLKSPHVYKKAREQFQLERFKCIFFLKNFTNTKYIKQLLLNRPKTIKIKIKQEKY